MAQSSGAIVPSPSTSECRKLLRDVLPLSLITSYGHVDLLGAASVDLPQQAGIPCLAAAVATAIEQQVGIQRSTSTWSATRSSKRSSSSTRSTPSSVQSCPAPAPTRPLRPQCQASDRCDCTVGGVRGNGLRLVSLQFPCQISVLRFANGLSRGMSKPLKSTTLRVTTVS